MPEENLPRKNSLPKGIIWGVVALILIFAVSLAVHLYDSSRQAASLAANNLNKLEEGVSDLKNFNYGAAENNFGAAGSGLEANGSIWGEMGSFFGGAGDLISGLGGVTKEGTTLAEEVGFFESNLPDLLLNRKGDEIISHLETVDDSLKGYPNRAMSFLPTPRN